MKQLIDDVTQIEQVRIALGMLDPYEFRNRTKFGYSYKWRVYGLSMKETDNLRMELSKKIDKLKKKFPQLSHLRLDPKPYMDSDTSRRCTMSNASIREMARMTDCRSIRIFFNCEHKS
jgi:hypothetical protein